MLTTSGFLFILRVQWYLLLQNNTNKVTGTSAAAPEETTAGDFVSQLAQEAKGGFAEFIQR